MIKRVLLTLLILIAGAWKFMEKANAQVFAVNYFGQPQNSHIPK